MVERLENSFIEVSVKHMGAELSSIKTKDDASEHLWQGNPEVWSGQSPILFPIVGRLLNDIYTLENRHYRLPKHGFARKSMFELIEKNGDSMQFSLRSSAQTRELYPFDFELRITYAIENTSLNITYSVFNNDEKDMYFSIGAHPGFNCDMGDYVEFEQNESLEREYVDDSCIVIPETGPILKDSNKITITEDIFLRDALILSGYKSKSLSIKRAASNKVIRVHFGNAPYLGIWAKPGAKYVCIEPWYGLSDSYESKGDISKKRGIVRLEKNSRFDFPFSITIE